MRLTKTESTKKKKHRKSGWIQDSFALVVLTTLCYPNVFCKTDSNNTDASLWRPHSIHAIRSRSMLMHTSLRVMPGAPLLQTILLLFYLEQQSILFVPNAPCEWMSRHFFCHLFITLQTCSIKSNAARYLHL